MSSESKKGNRDFLMQGAVLAAAGMLTRLIGLAYRIPMNNILGDEGQGFYGVAFEIYSIALLLTSYSLPLAMSKLVSSRKAQGKMGDVAKVLKTGLMFALVVGGAVALIVFLAADKIATGVMSMHLSIYALRVLAPGLLIVAFLGVLRGFFQGLGTMYPTAVSQILEQIINAVVSLLAASYFFKAGARAMKAASTGENLAGAYGAAGGTLGTVTGAFAALVFLILLIYLMRGSLKRFVNEDSKQTEAYSVILRVLLVTIAPVILSTAIYNISQVMDQAVFAKIMSIQGYKESSYSAMLGMFSGKYNTLINVPLAIANALAVSVIPSLTAEKVKGDTPAMFSKMGLSIRFAMVIAIPSFIGYLVLAHPIIDLLYTGNIDKPSLMLQIGSASVVFYCLSTVTNALLQGIDRMMTPVRNAAISLFIHLVSLLIMLIVFHLTIYAVVISNIVFSLCMCLFNQHSIKRFTGYQQEYRKTFVRPLVAAIIMGLVAFLVYHLFIFLHLGHFATLLSLVISVIVYAVALLMLGGLSRKELMVMPGGVRIVKLIDRFHFLSARLDSFN